MRAGRRTGQLALSRSLLGGLLLVAMWVLWTARADSMSSMTGNSTEVQKQLNKFAQEFAITFFVVQAVAVLLLTPVFVAGAIFEERETRSGEILLTTRLTRREVYVGKVGSRIVQVLLVALAGVPILSLTLLWGGVDIGLIIVCYIVIGISAFGAGTITAAVSAYAESMRSAILKSYLFIILFDGVIFPASPFLLISMSAGHWVAGACAMVWYVPLQVTIVVVSYGIGQRWLRLAMLRQKKRLHEGEREPPPLPGQTGGGLKPLSDTQSPLLWKELLANKRVKWDELLRNYFRVTDVFRNAESIEMMGPLRWFLISPQMSAFFLRFMLMLVVLVFSVLMFNGGIPPEGVLPILGNGCLLWLMLAVGLTTSSGVAKERQKQTLIDLFMLPGPRSDFLWAKMVGGLAHGLLPIYVLLGLLVLTAVAGGVSALAIPGLAIATVPIGLAAGSFGIWLSTRCRTIVQSNVFFMGALGLLLIGSYLVAEANAKHIAPPVAMSPGGSRAEMAGVYPAWSRVINPLMTWDGLIFGGDRTPLTASGTSVAQTEDRQVALVRDRCLASLGGVAFWFLVAGFFWWLAVRQFEREGRD